MTQGNIYFDFNATTPVDKEVVEKLPEWLALWGNPSSIHLHGRGSKKILREARRKMAEILNCHPLEIVYTSGGSEANNLAIKGTLTSLLEKQPQRTKVLLGAIEHPSVLKLTLQLEKMGFSVHTIPVSKKGEYDLEKFKSLLDESVALVSVMLANNEVGVIAPIAAMVQEAKKVGALFHSDMVQALGKIPFDLNKLGVDLASFSSHKVYALKGSGLVFVKKGTPFQALTMGGSQERGRRAGTENLLAIASFSHMANLLDPENFMETSVVLRDQFEEVIKSSIAGVSILGEGTPRLPNTSCFTIEDVSGESLLMNLDIRGFSVGTGAACSSGNPEPSPVLLAMGLSRDEAQSSLRVSLGKNTSLDEVLSLAANLKEVAEHLRSLQGEEVNCV